MQKNIAPLLLLAGISSNLHAELQGNFSLEHRWFPEQASFEGQHDHYTSMSVEPEYYTDFDGSDFSLTVKPFLRATQYDSARSHADLREFFVYYATDNWEWRFGINKVYWGVTESNHLVDTINQTDFVENIDGEDKLGQPMIQATWLLESSAIDFFILPGFRERTFPGENGRLRGPLPVDTSAAEFESSDQEQHVDYAIRWSGLLFDNWDIGLHYFDGTSRDPVLEVREDNGESRLIPKYYQMSQVGLDLQATLEAWLLKLEAIHRSTEPEDFSALVGGFEYSLVDLTDSGLELGIIGEYLYDDRGKDSAANFQNDIFIGTRWAFNDAQSTEILAGGIFDLDRDNRSFRVEASRRLGQDKKLSLEAQIFEHIDPADNFYPLRNDDFLTLELGWYF